MKLSDLIESLQKLKIKQGDCEVMILDGNNGQGTPRDVNYGPFLTTIKAEHAEAAADCEERVGERVVLMGFGCY